MKAVTSEVSIGKIFNNIFHRNMPQVKRLKNKLLSYNRFQNYILNLSNSFINIPFSKIDDAISESLKHFCDLYDYDHSSIWTTDDKERIISCRYSWSNVITLSNDYDLTLCYDQLEGFFDFKNFTEPVFLKISDYNPQNMDFREILITAGINALYIFPLMNEGVNFGGVVLCTCNEYEKLDENTYIAGQLYCALITSVLLRKEREYDFKDSSETTEIILDSVNEGVALYDRDGSILYLSKYIRDKFGEFIQTEEKITEHTITGLEVKITGQTVTELEELNRSRTEKFNQVVKTGEKLVFEDNIGDEWFSNRIYPILKDGQVRALTVITEDITDLKQTETLQREAKVLKQKEHEYLEIIDGSTVASWIHDYTNNTLRLSLEWKKRIGCVNIPEEDLLKYVGEHMNPDDLKRIGEERNAIFKNNQIRFKHEYRIKTISGDYIWVMDQGKIIYDENGSPAKVYGTTMDINDAKRLAEEATLIESALKQSEQHALKLVEELQRADKNKNEFINILSHELRNPLATIVAGLSLLKLSTDKSVIQSSTEIIDRQLKQLCKLVDDLLDLTRINNNKIMLKKELTNLNIIALNTYHDLLSFFKEKDIAFTINLQDSCAFMFDPARIKQILENLLHNALNYTDNGGMVCLTVSKNDKEAVISVKDNGIGLDPDTVPLIFEPFIQGENSLVRSNGGLGLGLSIVKNITALHGGHVYAHSEGLGKGSEFIIYLPIMCET